MLVASNVSDDFLHVYKFLLWLMNDGKEPETLNRYVALRNAFYENREKWIEKLSENIKPEFQINLNEAFYGDFVYLKKYKLGYAFQHVASGKYFLARALTSPIEEFTDEFAVIKTAILRFKGNLVCDGLIQHKNVYLGTNLIKEVRDGYWAVKREGVLQTS